MGRQLPIKLNEKQFGPILEFFRKEPGNANIKDSALVAEIIFHHYLAATEHNHEGKTRGEILLAHWYPPGTTKELAILRFKEKFRTYIEHAAEPLEDLQDLKIPKPSISGK